MKGAGGGAGGAADLDIATDALRFGTDAGFTGTEDLIAVGFAADATADPLGEAVAIAPSRDIGPSVDGAPFEL
ncbi:MAG TPA: hypothetical protein VMU41_04075 [Candidatus Binataceae bacterium]|nr:hypothetical protein [Candidatus Binataceae bacterium]